MNKQGRGERAGRGIGWAGLRIAMALLAADPASIASRGAIVGAAALLSAQADARSLSSGGYSRSGGSSGRTSSSGGGWSSTYSGGGGSSFSRRPSSSGGYARPSDSGGSSFSGGSASDQALSRRNSAGALRDYNQRFAAPPPAPVAPRPAAPQPPASGAYGGYGGDYMPRRPPAGGWGYGGGVPYGASPTARFGAFDGLMLWGLLGALSSQNSTRFFQDNRNDPGYQEWRRQADQLAQQNDEVRQRLAELDRRLAQTDAGGSSPAAAAAARPADSASGSGSGFVWILLLAGAALFAFLWLRRRSAASTQTAARAATGLSGSKETRFRIGMTLPLDPSPFVLAGAALKVPPPPAPPVSVEAVGVVSDGALRLHRLYLPGAQSFVAIHLAADGRPDEARYFGQIDTVAPGSADEWQFWLDPAEGAIGWPEFQTKDGKTYQRVWSPGRTRVGPRQQDETIETLQALSQRKLASMLYGAPSGLQAPAPDTEYVLVTAVQAGDQAWVEVHAGIDINLATLDLPLVPLSS